MKNIYSKKMKISLGFKRKLESTIGIKNVEYTYIPGGLIQFAKINFDCINPNKIIIKKSQEKRSWYYTMENITTKKMHYSYTMYITNVV